MSEAHPRPNVVSELSRGEPLNPACFQQGRLAALVCYVALSLVAIPASAQWVVKTKRVEERSKDDHISLIVDLPVLTGDANPAVRKAINRTLGLATGVDKLQREAKKAIRRHSEALKRKNGSQDDDDEIGEDFPDDQRLEYAVGLNDGHIFSLCLNGYWHGGGGAVGNANATGYTFNAETGQALTLNDLLAADWQKPLKDLMKKKLEKRADELFPNWVASLGKTQFEFWLSKDGLEVDFPKYSLAPGVMGVISVKVSYEDLRPLIPKGGILVGYLKQHA